MASRKGHGNTSDWLLVRWVGVSIINLLVPTSLWSMFLWAPNLKFSHLGRVWVSTKQLSIVGIVLCIPWGRARTPPYSCSIVNWLLLLCIYICSLPFLARVWSCPLELREGHGNWMKPIAYNYKKKKMRDTERFSAQESHKVSKPLHIQRLAIEAFCLLEPCVAGKKFNCPEALIL